MKNILNLTLLFCFFCLSSVAQKDPALILDHPGIFKLIDWGVYTHYNCGFTKA
jgi:hypothetical protein